MLAPLAGLTQQQQQLGRSLPLPIAAAWQHLLLASGQRQAEHRLILTVDVVVRTLAALAVADYLRGPAAPEVDQALANLDEADRSVWWPLLAALAASAPPEPAHILAPLALWLRTPQGNRPSGLEQLRQCLFATSHPIEASAADFTRTTRIGHSVGLVAGLLESLAWLAQWRLLQVASLTTVRRGGFRGELHLLAGAQVEPNRHAATWTAHLLANTLYLANPEGDALLEVSPLLALEPQSRRQAPHCQLWCGVRAPDQVLLAEIPSERQSAVVIHGQPSDERPWLAAVLQPFLHHDPQLAAHLPPPPAYQLPTVAPPRPIADLSDHAFAAPEEATRRSGWSRRVGLALQAAVLLALVVAAAVGLAPKPRTHPAPEPLPTPIAQAAAVTPPGTPSAVAASAPADGPAPAAPAVAVAAEASPVAAPVGQVAAAAPPAELAQIEAPDGQVAPTPAEVAAAAPPPPVAPPEPPPPAPPPPVAPPPPPPVAALPQPVAAGEFLEQARRDAALRPAYAVLKLQVAKEQGHPHADLALAAVHAQAGSQALCRHYARLALAAHPADAAAGALVTQCHGQVADAAAEPVDPPDPKGLTQRLYREGYSIIYGARHSPSERRKMAKDLYLLAAARGYAKAHSGLAAIYWYGERDKAKCREHAQVALQAGPDSQAKQLMTLCSE